MPAHRHLKRLALVWKKQPVYFVTTCVAGRRHLLADVKAHAIFREEWAGLRERHGWAVGRYVVMPDHVHFFLMSEADSPKPLHAVVGKWKEWTAKRLSREAACVAPVWQREFFDHLLRSDESRSEKWTYMRENPVRAGLASKADDWPFAGWVDFE
jgi:REP element-mobilizing transposase RayT